MTAVPDEPTLFSTDEVTGELGPTPTPAGSESALSTTEPAWSVPLLYDAIGELLEARFGSPIWITGELRSLNASNAGHRYFELVEPGTGEDHAAPRLNVTLFARHRRRVNAQLHSTGNAVQIEEGTIVRIRGDLRTYSARSTLQLVMTGIDPAYTLGVVGQRREAVLSALREEGILGANATVPVPYPTMSIALVTSRGSAAEADALHELECAGIGLRIAKLDARTQGAEAERSLIAALRTAESLGVDLVLLVRGGGSASDLAVFDSEALARTICGLRIAVFTGIGHETDRSVADEVAHTAHKTPTAAAAAVAGSAVEARRCLEQLAASLRTAAPGAVARAQRDLLTVARSSAFASRQHLDREDRLLGARLDRIGTASPLVIGRLASRIDDVARRLRSATTPAIDRAARRLDSTAALVSARDPRVMLRRGWSLTHDSDGNLVRSVRSVKPGELLVTTLGDGTLASTVSSTEPKGDPT